MKKFLFLSIAILITITSYATTPSPESDRIAACFTVCTKRGIPNEICSNACSMSLKDTNMSTLTHYQMETIKFAIVTLYSYMPGYINSIVNDLIFLPLIPGRSAGFKTSWGTYIEVTNTPDHGIKLIIPKTPYNVCKEIHSNRVLLTDQWTTNLTPTCNLPTTDMVYSK